MTTSNDIDHLVDDRTSTLMALPTGWTIDRWVKHLINRNTYELLKITDKILRIRTTLNERAGILSTLHASMKIVDYLKEIELKYIENKDEFNTLLTNFKNLINVKVVLLRRYNFKGIDSTV